MSKAALITGAAKRIGRATALALAGAGYDIALHYSTSQGDAETAAQEIIALGRRCALLRADLADTAAARQLVPQAVKELGGLDLLVNNASGFERDGFLDADEAFFDHHMTVNFKTPFFLAQEFARVCKGGHIINLLDTKIAKPSKVFFVYTLSKKALADFTIMAAKLLAPAIRVNGICPGPMLPPPGGTQADLDKLMPLVPLARIGNADMIARAVLFLAENDFITGEILYVDGGQHL